MCASGCLRSVRLYVNFFQPSFELMEKTRDGARVTKRYHPPLTPFQRVQAHPAAAQAAKDELAAQFAQLDPVVLLHDVREAQAQLTAPADAPPPAEGEGNPKADVEAFLDGLRHVWKEGEIRPTSRKKPSAPRGRRRPDPLAEVTDDLRAWSDEEVIARRVVVIAMSPRRPIGRLRPSMPSSGNGPGNMP